MKMTAQRISGILVVAALALVGAGCDQPQQSSEAIGQKVDRAADSAIQGIDKASKDAAAKTGDMAAKATAALDDATVTAKVKAALMAEPGLKSTQIEVETQDGIVTLAGNVENPTLGRRAIQLANTTEGVRQVVDKLAVRPS